MVSLKEVRKSFKEDHLSRPLIRLVYSHLAVFVSWIAISLGMHAHLVNLLGLLGSLIAAYIIFYVGGAWLILAGSLVIFGLVIDLSDGTVARYYKNKNAMGKWLDESSGFIGVALIFFALMMRHFIDTGDLLLISLGTYTIFSYLMINYAALLSEVLRAKFELSNPLDNMRNSLSKSFFGINPGAFAFSLDIQWTLIALGVFFNAPYFLFITFSILSTIQWGSRYVIFFGK